MSDRWGELRLRKPEPTPVTASNAQNVSVPYFGNSGFKEPPESDTQVHGLYQEDLAAGIVCAECKRVAEWPDQFGRVRSYRDVVLFNHGVTLSVIQR